MTSSNVTQAQFPNFVSSFKNRVRTNFIIASAVSATGLVVSLIVGFVLNSFQAGLSGAIWSVVFFLGFMFGTLVYVTIQASKQVIALLKGIREAGIEITEEEFSQVMRSAPEAVEFERAAGVGENPRSEDTILTVQWNPESKTITASERPAN